MSCEIYWFYAHFGHELLDFVAELQCGETWEDIHSNSSGSPSSVSKVMYCGESLNQIQLFFPNSIWC